MKINRQEVYDKCGGHCAYCGKDLSIKEMQVDHITPRWHTLSEEQANKANLVKGTHYIDNLNPSCARCNKWKSTYSLERFRNVIETSLDRLNRDSPNYRLALDYGLITEIRKPIVFYFELAKQK